MAGDMTEIIHQPYLARATCALALASSQVTKAWERVVSLRPGDDATACWRAGDEAAGYILHAGQDLERAAIADAERLTAEARRGLQRAVRVACYWSEVIEAVVHLADLLAADPRCAAPAAQAAALADICRATEIAYRSRT